MLNSGQLYNYAPITHTHKHTDTHTRTHARRHTMLLLHISVLKTVSEVIPCHRQQTHVEKKKHFSGCKMNSVSVSQQRGAGCFECAKCLITIKVNFSTMTWQHI